MLGDREGGGGGRRVRGRACNRGRASRGGGEREPGGKDREGPVAVPRRPALISDPSRGQLEVSSRRRPRRRQAAPGRPWLLSISGMALPLVFLSPLSPPREAESSRPCSRQPQARKQARRTPRLRLLVAPQHLRRWRVAVSDWPCELQRGPSTHPRSFGRRMRPLGGWSHVHPSRYPYGPYH
jgi:hypothetical protein